MDEGNPTACLVVEMKYGYEAVHEIESRRFARMCVSYPWSVPSSHTTLALVSPTSQAGHHPYFPWCLFRGDIDRPSARSWRALVVRIVAMQAKIRMAHWGICCCCVYTFRQQVSCLMRPKDAEAGYLGATSLSAGESKSMALVSPRTLKSANCQVGFFLNWVHSSSRQIGCRLSRFWNHHNRGGYIEMLTGSCVSICPTRSSCTTLL
jgi:hypothetical protein